MLETLSDMFLLSEVIFQSVGQNETFPHSPLAFAEKEKRSASKLCPQIIIHQAHSGKELCHHIVKTLTMMTTQLPHQTVFIQLTMTERGMAINPLKTT